MKFFKIAKPNINQDLFIKLLQGLSNDLLKVMAEAKKNTKAGKTLTSAELNQMKKLMDTISDTTQDIRALFL